MVVGAADLANAVKIQRLWAATGMMAATKAWQVVEATAAADQRVGMTVGRALALGRWAAAAMAAAAVRATEWQVVEATAAADQRAGMTVGRAVALGRWALTSKQERLGEIAALLESQGEGS